jgi:hypothetical protein
MAIDDCEIDPFRLPSSELCLQPLLRPSVLRKDDQARRVAIDPMDDERTSLTAWPQVMFDLVVDRWIVFPRERDNQQSRRLVDDE